jgi:hypothetical protein
MIVYLSLIILRRRPDVCTPLENPTEALFFLRWRKLANLFLRSNKPPWVLSPSLSTPPSTSSSMPRLRVAWRRITAPFFNLGGKSRFLLRENPTPRPLVVGWGDWRYKVWLFFDSILSLQGKLTREICEISELHMDVGKLALTLPWLLLQFVVAWGEGLIIVYHPLLSQLTSFFLLFILVSSLCGTWWSPPLSLCTLRTIFSTRVCKLHAYDLAQRSTFLHKYITFVISTVHSDRT